MLCAGLNSIISSLIGAGASNLSNTAAVSDRPVDMGGPSAGFQPWAAAGMANQSSATGFSSGNRLCFRDVRLLPV